MPVCSGAPKFHFSLGLISAENSNGTQPGELCAGEKRERCYGVLRRVMGKFCSPCPHSQLCTEDGAAFLKKPASHVQTEGKPRSSDASHGNRAPAPSACCHGNGDCRSRGSGGYATAGPSAALVGEAGVEIDELNKTNILFCAAPRIRCAFVGGGEPGRRPAGRLGGSLLLACMRLCQWRRSTTGRLQLWALPGGGRRGQWTARHRPFSAVMQPADWRRAVSRASESCRFLGDCGGPRLH